MKVDSRYKIYGFVSALVWTSMASALAAYSIRVDFSMPPPPREGSAAHRKDYEVLHRLQEKRTREECQIAGSQSHMDVASFFGPDTGFLTARQFAALEPVLKELKETVAEQAKPYKQHYARPRPYAVDESLKPCISKPAGATSYPSSHASLGIVLGKFLAEVFPARADEFLAEGEHIGEYRVIGGVHHPSDVRAGQDLGDAIYSDLKRDPDFKADLIRLRSKF